MLLGYGVGGMLPAIARTGCVLPGTLHVASWCAGCRSHVVCDAASVLSRGSPRKIGSMA